MKDFLPPDLTVKHFKGEGNEYAAEVETFFQSEGEYLPSYVNNGGTQVLKIYQVTTQGIYVVYEEPEYYEETPPSISSLQDDFQKVEVLTLPLEKGKTINGWEIVGTDESLTLPLGTVSDIVVLEKTFEDGSISRNYWAKKLGLVKKEYYYKAEDGTELAVTTELESVEKVTQ